MKTKKAYSPLRNRNPGSSQALEHPVLFKNSSIDGSKDALKESRSRSKSSEKGGAAQGTVKGYHGGSLRMPSSSAKQGAGAGGMRKGSNQRLHSGDRPGLVGAPGLKFIRHSARDSRSPGERINVNMGGTAGLAPYAAPRPDTSQAQAELKGILMNNNYVRENSQNQRYGGAGAYLGPQGSTP